MDGPRWGEHSRGTVTAQSPHSHRTVTAQSPRSGRAVVAVGRARLKDKLRSFSCPYPSGPHTTHPPTPPTHTRHAPRTTTHYQRRDEILTLVDPVARLDAVPIIRHEATTCSASRVYRVQARGEERKTRSAFISHQNHTSHITHHTSQITNHT